MAESRRDIERCLRNKFGFQDVPGTKHDAISLIVEGRKVATTRFSRGHAELSDSILTIILLHMPAPHRTDDETTPRTPEEIELVRNLLRGLRRFERAGVIYDVYF